VGLVELLTVEERFQLSGAGLTVIPDFSVPSGWRNRQETVRVVTPEGQAFEALAQFTRTHFKINDPTASVDRRWRVLLSLPEARKEQVPIGSRVLVSIEVHNAVLPGSVA
jgi:hypothetical protein